MDSDNDNSDTDAEYVPDKSDLVDKNIDAKHKNKRMESTAWKHFKKPDDPTTQTAQCNYCQNVLSYKTGVSNLQKHIQRKHSDVFLLFDPESLDMPGMPPDDKSDASVNASDDSSSEETVQNSSNVSRAWYHFEKIENYKAQCKHCSKQLSYKSSVSNLVKHVHRSHSDIRKQYEPKVPDDKDLPDKDNLIKSLIETSLSNSKRHGNKPSVVWTHFERKTDSLAKCNYCGKELSYKTSVSNLKKHLKYIHLKQERRRSSCTDVSEMSKEEDPFRLSPNGKEMGIERLEDFEADDISTVDRNSSDNEKSQEVIFRRNREDVWKYFEQSDGNKAKCKLCQQMVTCKSDSNLKYHIIKEHGKVEFADAKSSDEEKDVHLDDEKGIFSRKSRSRVWKYYTRNDPVDKVATCKICHKNLSYQSTIGNLMKHIRRSHGKHEFVLNDDDEEKPQVIKVKTTSAESLAGSSFVSRKKQETKVDEKKRFRKCRSSIWKYFDVQDQAAKKAKCRLCNCNFIYTCLSNLNKHLARTHGLVAKAEDKEMEIVTTSPIWAYFKCLDERLKIASCLICKKRIEYNGDSDLTKHLTRKHPHVDFEEFKNKPKKLMITDNGDIYEIDDDVAKEEPEQQDDDDNDSDDWNNHNDEIEALHSTEYIDEEMIDEPTPSPITKKRKRSSNIPNSNVPQKQEECSIEIFGKYVVSLLKKLPKHTSDRLQVDFVRQIMEAQLNDDRNISYNQNTRYESQVQNTRYDTSFKSQVHNRYLNDDTRVTSNSEVQRDVARDGTIHALTGNEQITVSSAGPEITIETT